MLRNANGDLLHTDTAQSYYCGTCFHYLGPTGERVPYESKGVILWIECSVCLIRRLEREAEEEERRCREEERRRPRECELDGCGELFVAATRWQAYCCDEHRWKAHRLAKASRRLRLPPVTDKHRAA
jgi:hypothetical protein